ncbi:MFS transporter [Micromonospora sp. LOL_025]|uniref:MFS transporter n=1 Tax=Micromonospora sp. LOL_025 TaxID=3345413 RepID=UPI003A89E195
MAGLLVGTLGALTALAVDAVTFAVSAAAVPALVPASLRPADSPTAASGGYWQDFMAGLRFLIREPLLRAMVLLVLVTNLLDATKSNVLLPVVATRDLGGAAAFGLLVGAMGGGALVGSLLFSAVGHGLPRRPPSSPPSPSPAPHPSGPSPPPRRCPWWQRSSRSPASPPARSTR